MTKIIRMTPVMATIIFLPTEERKNEEVAVTGLDSQPFGRWIFESRSRVFCVKAQGRERSFGARQLFGTGTQHTAGRRAIDGDLEVRGKTFRDRPAFALRRPRKLPAPVRPRCAIARQEYSRLGRNGARLRLLP